MKKFVINIRMIYKLLKLKLKGVNVFPIYVNGYVLVVNRFDCE